MQGVLLSISVVIASLLYLNMFNVDAIVLIHFFVLFCVIVQFVNI